MSNKSPEMVEVLNEMTKALFGREYSPTECPFCGEIVNGPEDFRDAVSWEEHSISYLCQKCQDKVFCEPPDEY